jgi:Uma2 family endonuclease
MNPTATLEPMLTAPPVVIDDDAPYEIIDGIRVELPPMSVYATLIASELARKLGNHGETHELGKAIAEGLFRLPLDRDRNRNRKPDAAFVSFARWPKDRPIPLSDNAWDVVPDLAVEVISPTDRFEEIYEKIAEYFEAGVRQAWVLLPSLQMVLIYESLNEIRSLTRTDELDGGALLPGFHMPVGSLFPPMQAAH